MSQTFKGAIKPLHDRVLLKRMENEQMSAGGIYIPDTAQEKTQCATVIATGTGKVLQDGSIRALNVKAGDKVIFGKFSGTEVSYSGQDYLILREEEILGLLD